MIQQVNWGRERVMEILPHREPMLLVDGVRGVEVGKSIDAFFYVRPDMEILKATSRATLLPGVYSVESMAQAAGIMVILLDRYKGRQPLFLGIDKASFRRVVRPGDTLELHGELIHEREDKAIVTCAVEGRVNGRAGRLRPGGSGHALTRARRPFSTGGAAPRIAWGCFCVHGFFHKISGRFLWKWEKCMNSVKLILTKIIYIAMMAPERVGKSRGDGAAVIITRETDYALRILRALSRGTQLTAGEIAEQELVPKQFAYKIMKKLSRADLVAITRGVDGGCRLKADLDQVTLYDLMAAMEESRSLSACMEPGYRCPWREAMEAAPSTAGSHRCRTR